MKTKKKKDRKPAKIRQRVEPFALCRLSCSGLYDRLTRGPADGLAEHKNLTKLKKIIGDRAADLLLGAGEPATEWKLVTETRERIAALPHGTLTIGGAPVFKAGHLQYSKLVKTIADAMFVNVEAIDGNCFILDQ